MRPISAGHSPELIDNLYLTRVHSTGSSTDSAFMVHIYLPDSSTEDRVNLVVAQLDEMQKAGAHTSSANITTTMIVGTRTSTYLTNEPPASGT